AAGAVAGRRSAEPDQVEGAVAVEVERHVVRGRPQRGLLDQRLRRPQTAFAEVRLILPAAAPLAEQAGDALAVEVDPLVPGVGQERLPRLAVAGGDGAELAALVGRVLERALAVAEVERRQRALQVAT